MIDPVEEAFFHRDVKQNEWLESRPICNLCHHHIQEEYCFDVPKIGFVCQRCMEDCTHFIGD